MAVAEICIYCTLCVDHRSISAPNIFFHVISSSFPVPNPAIMIVSVYGRIKRMSSKHKLHEIAAGGQTARMTTEMMEA